MPSPSTIADFLAVVRKSQQIDPAGLEKVPRRRTAKQPASPRGLAEELIRAGVLTAFQAEQFSRANTRGSNSACTAFSIVSAGGLGAGLSRGTRGHGQARGDQALAAGLGRGSARPRTLPPRGPGRRRSSITRTSFSVYDLRQEGAMHYMVMEYVEGPTMHQLLNLPQRLAVGTACEYARQTALGLHHAHLSRPDPSRHQAGQPHRRSERNGQDPRPRPGPL